MKYIWILKYILYSTFSRKNVISAYQEGGIFGCLLIFPFMSFFLFFGVYDINLLYCIGLFIFAFEVVITWDYDKVMDRYHKLDLNKWKMEKEFRFVRWTIFIDILVFVLSLFYNAGKQEGWF